MSDGKRIENIGPLENSVVCSLHVTRDCFLNYTHYDAGDGGDGDRPHAHSSPKDWSHDDDDDSSECCSLSVLFSDSGCISPSVTESDYDHCIIPHIEGFLPSQNLLSDDGDDDDDVNRPCGQSSPKECRHDDNDSSMKTTMAM